MKKNVLVLTLLGMVIGLSACTSSSFDFLKGNQEKNTARPNPDETADSSLVPPPEVESVGTIGGSMSNAMNSADRSKLAHALDNPLGKSSTWTNRNSGITYTVTPTNKTTVNEIAKEQMALFKEEKSLAEKAINNKQAPVSYLNTIETKEKKCKDFLKNESLTDDLLAEFELEQPEPKEHISSRKI